MPLFPNMACPKMSNGEEQAASYEALTASLLAGDQVLDQGRVERARRRLLLWWRHTSIEDDAESALKIKSLCLELHENHLQEKHGFHGFRGRKSQTESLQLSRLHLGRALGNSASPRSAVSSIDTVCNTPPPSFSHSVHPSLAHLTLLLPF